MLFSGKCICKSVCNVLYYINVFFRENKTLINQERNYVQCIRS